jgi:hypothetical protein
MYAVFWLVWVALGAILGASKGRVGSGLVWTLLFGPIGLIVVAALPSLKKADAGAAGGGFCAKCGAPQAAEARFCPACGAAVGG